MNIFVTSYDPKKCAEVLDDRRLKRMTLETAQLLSGALLIGPLNLTHQNHPCAQWVQKSTGNFRWLLAHFAALLTEHHERFDKDHDCVAYAKTFFDYVENLEDGEVTPFVNATPYKDEPDVLQAYRKHLQRKWQADAAQGWSVDWGGEPLDAAFLADLYWGEESRIHDGLRTPEEGTSDR